MQKTYTVTNDPGHGWAKVPLGDLDALGIRECISPYSFIGDFAGKETAKTVVYLEEDCDLSFFMHKAKEAGWTVDLKDNYVQRFNRNRPSYPFGTAYSYEANAREMYGPRD